MIKKRESQERGHANFGWLDSYHSFSFGNYYDPAHTQFRSLRVINEDRIAPKGGFPLHPHKDMEILTYVIKGAIAHRDSMGNEKVVKAGGVQKMTAGTGVRHSEFNPSADEETHMLQIWITPKERGLEPSYSEWLPEDSPEGATLVASPEGREGSIRVEQDVELSRHRVKAGESLSLSLANGRALWIQVFSGAGVVGGEEVVAGDAIAAEEEETIVVSAKDDMEFLVFDLG